MQKLNSYLEATFLKNEQDGCSLQCIEDSLNQLFEEAVNNRYHLVMVRPEWVQKAQQFMKAHRAKVGVGTVIDFPLGNKNTEEKLLQAQQAIAYGADELDVVIDYKRFQLGDKAYIREQVAVLTAYVRSENKTIKWIIETAALSADEIITLCALIKNTVLNCTKEIDYEFVFVKSSTGYFVPKDGKESGATTETLVLMVENAVPLPVKASGGIKSWAQVQHFIDLGVKRIGTSSAKTILEQAVESGAVTE